jgi:hypothetical protein
MDKFNPKPSEKTCFSETVVASTEGVGSSTSYDNMVQQRDIHCGGSFP